MVKNKHWLADKYIQHRKYLSKGYDEVYWIKFLLQFFAYVSALGFFAGLPTKILIPASIISGILFLVTCWFIGFLWDKYNMYHIEAEFGNQRNWLSQYIRAKLK